MTKDKQVFFEQYNDCAEEKALEIIWKALVNGSNDIDLSDLAISNISPLIEFEKLSMVDISDTQVSDLEPIKHLINQNLPIQWKSYDGSNGIFVKNCPLNNPPIEIVKLGTDAVIRHFKEKNRIGADSLKEARLLILGEKDAGKTTLKNRLMNLTAEANSILGVDQKDVEIQYLDLNAEGLDFILHIWDFARRNIDNYFHQLFMSDSVVYALVTNQRTQNPNFPYWLNAIETIGKKSPVIIVLNEVDNLAEPLANRAAMQSRFDNICSFHNVNLKNPTDPRFKALRESLISQAQILPHVNKKYTISFGNIRKKIIAASKDSYVLPYSEFTRICHSENVKNDELIEDYAKTLTILGIAFYFPEDTQLKKQIFLRPDWIIEALLKLISHERIISQGGRFTEEDADIVWEELAYNDFQIHLLRLMERFGLCYKIYGANHYIIPKLLPDRNFLFREEATQINFRYVFMPKGILTRLICRLNHYIDGDKVWNESVQFTDKRKEAKIFVREIYEEDSIELNAWGNNKESLLEIIIDTLDSINESPEYGDLPVNKKVPCSCQKCINLSSKAEKHEFDFDFLKKKLAQKGDILLDCQISPNEVYISEILKQSGIKVFKEGEVKKMIESNRLKEAINLINGRFPDSKEMSVLKGRLNNTEKQRILGQVSHDEYTKEVNKISSDILNMLEMLIEESN